MAQREKKIDGFSYTNPYNRAKNIRREESWKTIAIFSIETLP